MKFPLKLPMKDPRMTIQLWDKDLVKYRCGTAAFYKAATRSSH